MTNLQITSETLKAIAPVLTIIFVVVVTYISVKRNKTNGANNSIHNH